MREREISLMDLTVQILLQWRNIAAAILAGAVLAGIFSYVQSYQARKAQMVQEEFEKEEQMDWPGSAKQLEGGLTDAQIQNVKAVLTYEGLYQSKLEYQQHSVLMQMNPNQVHRMELTFYVSSGRRRLSFDIERAYEDIVLSGGMHEHTAKKTDQKSADLAEIITLSRGSGGLAEGSSTFRVRIIHSDKGICQGIAAAAEEFLLKKHEELEQSMGGHNLEIVQKSYTVGADMDILERQKNVLNDLVLMSDTIVQRKALFTAEESQYYDSLAGVDADRKTGGKDHAEGEALSVSAGSTETSGVSVKHVAFGMFLAAFVYVFFLFMKYVLSRRICAADNLQDLYGIPQFGVVPKQGGQKKMFGFVDHWILSLKDCGRCRVAREEALRLSAAAVRMAAGKEGLDSICLIGCSLDKDAWEMCEVVKEQLGKENISCKILNNVLYNAEAMCGLEEVKGAVLVERVHAVLYSEVSQELDLLRRQKIVVLGGIVVES